MTPARMRRWLKPDQGYAILAAAQEFAAASEAERFIPTALSGVNVDLHVRKLTRGDPERAARVRRAVALLLAQLRTPTRVYYCVQTTFGHSGSDADSTRLVDCMLDERLDVVLAGLEDGSFDAWHHMEAGALHNHGW